MREICAVSICLLDLYIEVHYLVVVDPDVVCPVKGDCITTPDILRVEVLILSASGFGSQGYTHRDMDILDDDILVPSPNPQPLPLDDPSRANAHDTLITAHIQRGSSSIIICTRDPGPVGAGILDPGLSGGCSARADCGACTAALP